VQNWVIVVAGGSGSRMGSETPKQFLYLLGKPIILHTLEKFIEFDDSINIVVVLPKGEESRFQKIVAEHQFNHPISIVQGGTTRFHSVKNGLEKLENQGIVGIHDSVRPLVSVNTLKETYSKAKTLGNAIPVISPNDSMRWVDSKSNRSIDRGSLRIIQTPQCFKADLIKEAFNTEYQEAFTDDASVFEHAGYQINLVDGNRENIKLTTPEDLKIAESLLDH
jgi:2-C-methyl-D-erythritol 4-phosphate cytidylyltransferase